MSSSATAFIVRVRMRFSDDRNLTAILCCRVKAANKVRSPINRSSSSSVVGYLFIYVSQIDMIVSSTRLSSESERGSLKST